MHKDTLYKALQEPFDHLPSMRNELKELTQIYPWFQTAHVLLCKADQVAGHHEYDQHLKKAALYSVNRERLYQLIMQEKLDAAIERIEAEIQTMDEVIEEPQEIEITPVEPLEPAISEAEEAAPQETPIPESQDIQEEAVSSAKVKSEDFDELQRQVLVDAISSSIEKEVGEKEEVLGLQPEEDAQVAQAEEPSTASEIEVHSIGQTEVDTEELSPFTKWVMERAKSLNYASDIIAVSEGKKEVEEAIPRPKANPQELIDKFIKAEPKITPRKVEEYEVPKVIDAGLLDDDAFITETLAQVYAKQGNVSKAKKAYKLLSLKYPEKSIYFANQIKKLDQLKRK